MDDLQCQNWRASARDTQDRWWNQKSRQSYNTHPTIFLFYGEIHPSCGHSHGQEGSSLHLLSLSSDSIVLTSSSSQQHRRLKNKQVCWDFLQSSLVCLSNRNGISNSWKKSSPKAGFPIEFLLAKVTSVLLGDGFPLNIDGIQEPISSAMRGIKYSCLVDFRSRLRCSWMFIIRTSTTVVNKVENFEVCVPYI